MTDRSGRGEPLVLGIDSSTTGCKAIAWDLHGEARAEGRAALPLSMPRPLWHEQPAEAWWDAAVEAIRQVTQQIDGGRIAGMCITAQRESFVPVEAGLRTVRRESTTVVLTRAMPVI